MKKEEASSRVVFRGNLTVAPSSRGVDDPTLSHAENSVLCIGDLQVGWTLVSIWEFNNSEAEF